MIRIDKITVVIVKAVLILLFFSYSSIQAKEIDATTTQLRKAAQIWGFLKYYHPAVAEGKYNWDKELIDVLGKLNRNFSQKKTDQIFFDWIQRLGDVPLCSTCREESDLEIFDKNFDLKWLQSFDKDLSDKLENIRKNRFQGDHAYFTQSEENFVINFINEPEYDQDLWKDPNLRLLTLFRYWNYIEYFFPHKYLLETSWTSTLDALIPRYLAVKNETDFHLLLLETLTLIEDSHAFFKSDLTKDYFGKKSPPFRVKFVDNSAVVAEIYNDSLCNIDDIKLGDIITKVNSISIENLLNEKLKFVPGSNKLSKLRDAKSVVFNGSADTLKVSFRRGESLLSKYIKRYDLSLIDFDKKNLQSWEIMDGNVGYVNMGLLIPDMIETMMDSFANTKGIIFDLRNYPNGTFNTLCGYLNNEPKPFTKI
ncbi:hypothetical protein, partial [Fulvivirga lutimaris]|uniref:hypothetical protein n=1 Tax=Fulvivirga lutimaris TaxID=1819566 RepID=UPI001624DAFE